jgi:hypothetical protein
LIDDDEGGSNDFVAVGRSTLPGCCDSVLEIFNEEQQPAVLVSAADTA